MTSYSEYDLERDLREAHRARERAGRDSARRHAGSFGDWLSSRTTEHWIMFAIGFVAGAILF
ncbi:MAG: hypothetical protein VW644_05035 [Alphaproteobacteria bacterium]